MAQHDVEGDPETYLFWHEYQIVQCVGCDSVRFRLETQDEDSARYGEAPSVNVYPPVRTAAWKAKKELVGVPIVGEIYSQAVAAASSDLLLLAAAGLRACVEAICKEKKVVGANLYQKIDALAASGLLSKPQTELLHAARTLGNTALHELDNPAPEEIDLILDVVETLMKAIYVLPEKVSGLKKRASHGGPDPNEE